MASLAMATLLVFAGPARAQTYAGFTVTASTTNVSPGDTVTISGSGARGNCVLAATVNGTPIGTGTATATGSFSFTVTVPTDASGSVVVAVGCEGTAVAGTVTLTVGSAGPTVTSPGGLARTGSSDAIPATTIAIGLITGGAVVLGVSRRRRHSKSAA